MTNEEETPTGKTSVIAWQDSGGNCLWCRAPFPYRITCSGPWALDREDVRCSECDARMRLELLYDESSGTTVRTKPIEAGRAGLIKRRADAGETRDFINKHPVHIGDALELRRLPKKWIAGRYQWNGNTDEAAEFYPDDGGLPIAIDSRHIFRCES